MIIEKFKTVGILENYHFDYDIEVYAYDLTLLTNGNLVKNSHYADGGEISDLFSKEIQEAFDKDECIPLAVKVAAKYIQNPDNPEEDRIELEYISRKNGPEIDGQRTEKFTGTITIFERNKRSNAGASFKINTSDIVFDADINMFTGIDLTKPVTFTRCKFLTARRPFKTDKITDIKNI